MLKPRVRTIMLISIFSGILYNSNVLALEYYALGANVASFQVNFYTSIRLNQADALKAVNTQCGGTCNLAIATGSGTNHKCVSIAVEEWLFTQSHAFFSGSSYSEVESKIKNWKDPGTIIYKKIVCRP